MNLAKNGKASETIRCFIAILLDEHTKRRLRRIQTDIRSIGIHAGWPTAQNFHLTLKFLGYISEQKLPCIKTILSESSADKACFKFALNRLGAFPNTRHPKVIWIGPDKASPELKTLQQIINSKLDKCLDFAKENNFSPHITLSRIRHYANPGILKKAFEIKTGTIDISVRQIHLIKSRLTPSGAIHTSIFQTDLKPHAVGSGEVTCNSDDTP